MIGWTIDATSMDDWTAANSSLAGPSSLWWLSASSISIKTNDWHTLFAAGTFTSGSFIADPTMGDTSNVCDVSVGTWEDAAGGTSSSADCLL